MRCVLFVTLLALQQPSHGGPDFGGDPPRRRIEELTWLPGILFKDVR